MNNLDSVFCQCRSYSNNSNTHHHDFAQLIMPLQGRLSIETDNNDLQLDAEHLFFIPAGSDHAFWSRGRNEFLVLDIPITTFPELYTDNFHEELYMPMDDNLRCIRLLMSYESSHYHNRAPGLTNLFRYTSTLLFNKYTPISVQYIHKNYDRYISLKHLASLEHFNTTYYCEWFKKQLGVTPHAYIQQVRLKKAKELLSTTNLSILDIANLVGYEHQSSFTRLFQQHAGTSPRNYRNSYHG